MTAETSAPDTELDAKSKAIIEALQQDGRRSYAEIGRDIGMSEAAVRQRVSKLTAAGVMQIVAVTSPLQLGFNRQAMIGVKVSGDITETAEILSQLPQVDYTVVTAGVYDILIEVVCADDDELLALLRQLRSIEHVELTETMMYLKLWDQKYNWGTR